MKKALVSVFLVVLLTYAGAQTYPGGGVPAIFTSGGAGVAQLIALSPKLTIASTATSNATIQIGRSTNSVDVFIGRVSSVDCVCDGSGNPFLTFVGAAAGGAATGGLSSPAALISTGTVPTGNTGTCSTGVTVAGGSRVGTWTSTAICALAGTIILTALPAAPTGHNCFMTDRTTAGVVIEETTTTSTSASFVVRSLPTGTVPTVANDILQYSCLEY